MKTFSHILAFTLGCVATYLIVCIAQFNGPSYNLGQSAFPVINLSYSDFVTIMFTGATLVLAGVAIVIGIVAAISWRGMKDEARRSIRKEVREQAKKIDQRISHEAKEEIKKAVIEAGQDGLLNEALERALIAINQGKSKLSGELESEFDPEDNGDR